MPPSLSTLSLMLMAMGSLLLWTPVQAQDPGAMPYNGDVHAGTPAIDPLTTETTPVAASATATPTATPSATPSSPGSQKDSAGNGESPVKKLEVNKAVEITLAKDSWAYFSFQPTNSSDRVFLSAVTSWVHLPVILVSRSTARPTKATAEWTAGVKDDRNGLTLWSGSSPAYLGEKLYVAVGRKLAVTLDTGSAAAAKTGDNADDGDGLDLTPVFTTFNAGERTLQQHSSASDSSTSNSGSQPDNEVVTEAVQKKLNAPTQLLVRARTYSSSQLAPSEGAHIVVNQVSKDLCKGEVWVAWHTAKSPSSSSDLKYRVYFRTGVGSNVTHIDSQLNAVSALEKSATASESHWSTFGSRVFVNKLVDMPRNNQYECRDYWFNVVAKDKAGNKIPYLAQRFVVTGGQHCASGRCSPFYSAASHPFVLISTLLGAFVACTISLFAFS